MAAERPMQVLERPRPKTLALTTSEPLGCELVEVRRRFGLRAARIALWWLPNTSSYVRKHVLKLLFSPLSSPTFLRGPEGAVVAVAVGAEPNREGASVLPLAFNHLSRRPTCHVKSVYIVDAMPRQSDLVGLAE